MEKKSKADPGFTDYQQVAARKYKVLYTINKAITQRRSHLISTISYIEYTYTCTFPLSTLASLPSCTLESDGDSQTKPSGIQ